jgi:co-chaperonin GroES (HSP10)
MTMTEFAIDRTKEEAKAKQVPDPSGYHILCMVPKVEKTFIKDGRVEKTNREEFVEEQTSVVLYVVKLGPDAYKDKNKFPSGPWCREGDFIIVRSYTGTRLRIHGTEWRLLNDDCVEGVVENPIGINRAGG